MRQIMFIMLKKHKPNKFTVKFKIGWTKNVINNEGNVTDNVSLTQNIHEV